MDESMKKARERLMDEFRQASSAEKWTPECITLMKNLLKNVYYIDVICAKEDGEEYPGSEYMPEASYARGQRRNAMGQYSRNGSYDGRPISGNYPSLGMYPMNSYNNSYNDSYRRGGMSGRRYYDNEMGNIVHKMEHMMETETNPEKRMAIQEILGDIQMM